MSAASGAKWRFGTRAALTTLLLLAAGTGTAQAMHRAPLPAAAQGHQYRRGVVPVRGHFSRTLSTSSDLSYGGGVSGVGVTTGSPRVYLVFWGSQWGAQSTNTAGNLTLSGDPSQMAPTLEAFMKGLGTGGETWSGVMTQYCEGIAAGAQTCPSTAPHVGYPSGGAFAGVWVDESAPAPSNATGHDIGLEAVRAAMHFGNTTQASNRNAQYAIVSPTGTQPDGFNTPLGQFCAWHDYTGDGTLSGGAVSSPDGLLAFTNLPYVTDAGASCGQNFVNGGTAGGDDGVTIVEGHEYAETITDQYPAGGWLDPSGQENGDKCAWISSGSGASQDVTLTTGTFAVQSTWANDANGGWGGCEVSHAIVSPNTVSVTNPGNQSGTTGTAVNLQIQATDSGRATLSYAATGLPSGLTISSSSGVISGTPGAPGTWSVRVTASDSTGASGSTSFTWTVSSPASTCPAAQLLRNPGFETGTAAPWTSTTGVVRHSSLAEPARTGSYMALLDGYGITHTDTLSQTVAVPTGCSQYTLGFWLHIDTTETAGLSNDRLTVRVLNGSGITLGTLAIYTNLNAAAGYMHRSFNFAAYAGRTVTLRFTGSENSSRQTSFVIDDTALRIS